MNKIDLTKPINFKVGEQEIEINLKTIVDTILLCLTAIIAYYVGHMDGMNTYEVIQKFCTPEVTFLP